MSDINNLNPQVVWGATLLKDGATPELELTSVMATNINLEIKHNLWDVFPTVEWAFSYSSNLIESGDIYIGRPLRIFFNDPQRESIISFEFVVYSIGTGPGDNPSTIGNLVLLTLVPRWVFAQKVKSQAIEGTSSEVIRKVINSELIGYLKEGLTIHYQDLGVTTRYRTQMTPFTFLTKRVVPYLKGNNNTSSFFITQIDGTYDIVDVDTMRNTPRFTAISKDHPSLSTYYERMNDHELGKYFLFIHNSSISFGDSEGGGLWPLVSPSFVSLSTVSLGQVKNISDNPTLPNMTDNFRDRFSLVSPHKESSTSKYFIDESLKNQDDVYNYQFNRYTKELMEAQKATSLCYFNPFVRVGRIVTLVLNDPNGDDSLFFQDFIITGFAHKTDGLLMFTQIEMATTSLSSFFNIASRSDKLINIPN